MTIFGSVFVFLVLQCNDDGDDDDDDDDDPAPPQQTNIEHFCFCRMKFYWKIIHWSGFKSWIEILPRTPSRSFQKHICCNREANFTLWEAKMIHIELGPIKCKVLCDTYSHSSLHPRQFSALLGPYSSHVCNKYHILILRFEFTVLNSL